MNWSTKVWTEIDPIYQKILNMPYIQELKNGTLALDKFQFYLAQDAHYLGEFGRVLALIASRLNNLNDTLAFIRFAEGAVVVENALHESYFKEYQMKGIGNMEPSCHHYVHYLKSTAALAPIEVAVAAVLPCFWIYREVGNYIYQNSINNPYQKWIDTYAGTEFDAIVSHAISIVDKLANTSTENQQAQMTEAFIIASKMEYDFWQAAYDLRRWCEIA